MLLGISVSTEVFAAPITLSTSSSAGSCSINIGGTTYYFNPTGTNFEGMTSISNSAQVGSADDADFVVNGTYYKLVIPDIASDINTISNTYFGGKTSATSGAAINRPSGTFTIDRSNFAENKAENPAGGSINGGALSFSGLTEVKITNSRFSDNSAIGNGGAVIFDNIKTRGVAISDSQFISNKSINGNGGAIYLKDARSTTISNTKFIGNSAMVGGAIYSLNTSGSTNNIFISGSQFGDTSHKTDSIYLYDNSTVYFTGDETSVYSDIFAKDNSSVSVGYTSTSGTLSLYGSIDTNSNAILTVGSGSRLNLKSGSRLGDTLGLTLNGTLGLEDDFTWKQNYIASSSAIVDIASGAKLIFDNNSGTDIVLNNVIGSGTVQSTGNNLTINNISDNTNMNLTSGTATVSANDIFPSFSRRMLFY